MAELEEKIHELLTRSVSAIYPSCEALEEVLLSGKKLRVYLGVDPTGPHLHLGQLTNLLVLKKLQMLGHEIIFLVGDFTARIGDPTGKLAARKPLSEREVAENMKTFKEQAGRIIKFSGKNAVKIAFNSKWLAKMTLTDWLRLSANVTVQQMIERNMFDERIRAGKPIAVSEFSYPLMQGYDSVALDVDMEIGGTDQTFNMLVGRHLVKVYKNKEKLVLTTKLLEHPKTGEKLMNKSEGGMINLDDTPTDIFGKVMALDDVSMFPVAESCAEMPLEDIEKLRKGITSDKLNPRDAKLDIAEAVVETIYGKKEAVAAREEFLKIFSKKEMTADLPELKIAESRCSVINLVLASRVVKSRNQARRLVVQGAVELDGAIKNKLVEKLDLNGGEVVKIGKHSFFRIKI